MFNRLFGSKAQPQRVPVCEKIKVGCGAVHQFVRQVHREGVDRGAVASFGNTLTVEQTLTTSAGAVAAALCAVEQKVLAGPGEGTALYDSVAELGDQLAAGVDPRAVGVLVAVTDGMDEHSRRYKGDPAGAGAAYRRAVARCRSPIFTVLIGVGSDREIDRVALARLAEFGSMTLVTVDTIGKLGAVLADLGTQLQTGVVTNTVTDGTVFVTERRRVAQVQVIPYDYVILMDRSGSMANRG